MTTRCCCSRRSRCRPNAAGSVTLAAKVSYLVCKDICVPEDTRVELTLPVAGEAVPSEAAGEIAKAKAALPKPLPGQRELRGQPGQGCAAAYGDGGAGPVRRRLRGPLLPADLGLGLEPCRPAEENRGRGTDPRLAAGRHQRDAGKARRRARSDQGQRRGRARGLYGFRRRAGRIRPVPAAFSTIPARRAR